MEGAQRVGHRTCGGYMEGTWRVAQSAHKGMSGGLCTGEYHWLALSIIDLVGDNREFEV